LKQRANPRFSSPYSQNSNRVFYSEKYFLSQATLVRVGLKKQGSSFAKDRREPRGGKTKNPRVPADL